MTDIKLIWDGETIKQSVKIPDKKFTPKEIVDSIDNVRNQINQMEDQKNQLENNLRTLDKNIKEAKIFEKERREFEDKCVELQKSKLEFYINNIYQDCKNEAEKKAEIIINKDPSAYTTEHKLNVKYVEFQRLLATDKKISNNISRRLITKYLFDTPIFTNPFI